MTGENNKTKRMHIVETAIRLFQEKGYNNVSVTDICNEMGMTRSSFYYYFETKDEVLDNYFLRAELNVQDRLLSILDAGLYMDQFKEIFGTFLQQILEAGPEIMGQIYKQNLEHNIRQLVPQYVAMWDVYLRTLQKAQEAGEIKEDVAASDLLTSYLYASVGISMIWCNQNGSFDLVEEHWRILGAIMPAKGKR